MVDKQMFQDYVDFLKENDPYKRPSMVYENYDYAASHATLARCFVIHFKESHPELIEAAIVLMEHAVQKILTEEDEDGQIDVDQIIWGYNDLSVWYGTFKSDMERSFHFANKGLDVLRKTDDNDLCFGVRGQLWFNRWVCMVHLGREEQALKECTQKINEITLKKFNYVSNSMLYYGYQFLGYIAQRQKDYKLAIDHLEKAALFIDLQDEVRKYELERFRKILSIKENNPEECYKQLGKLLDMVSSMHQAWDVDGRF
jgi:hypothetical protein